MARRSPKGPVEVEQYDREARCIELRAQGLTFAQIAEETGYNSPSAASKAYHRALARRPAQNVDQLRGQESERLEYLWQKTADLIEHPTLVHSAIGKTVPDPRRPGEFLIDHSAQIRAIDEYRKLSESFRKLTGIDIGTNVNVHIMNPDEQREWSESMAFIMAVREEAKQVKAENARLTVENEMLRSQLSHPSRLAIANGSQWPV